MPNRRFRFVVEGRYPFPFDMLRYEGCYPASESPDSATMEDMHRAGVKVVERKPVRIEMEHVSERPDWQPTVGRWASFGWKAEEARRIG